MQFSPGTKLNSWLFASDNKSVSCLHTLFFKHSGLFPSSNQYRLQVHSLTWYCMARQCSPLRWKFMECSINNPALTVLMKQLVIGQRLKTPNFSAFHWSPRGSLASIGQHFVATRVVYLPKSTETSLITESDQSGPYHQLLQLCTVRTAWSDSDQAMRALHSCNSWYLPYCRTVRVEYETDIDKK